MAGRAAEGVLERAAAQAQGQAAAKEARTYGAPPFDQGGLRPVPTGACTTSGATGTAGFDSADDGDEDLFVLFLLFSTHPSLRTHPGSRTDMGGFTQPRHFQYLNVMDPTRKDKDSYSVRVSDERIRPSAAAYEPHTVYLAVTRYPIRWGHGRATRREVFSDFCKESELAERFKEMNYGTWKEESTALVKLQHGQPKQPVTTPAHWSCHSNSKEYIDLAVFPGSPEERTLLNKPASHRVRAILKEIGRLEQQAAAETASTSTPSDSSATPSSSPAPPRLPPHLAARKRELQQQLAEMKCELLPPVPKDFTRPPPPYLSPPLVVPFLTVTFPTRPLAATVARLCNAHPRGLPFIASIPDDDRKDGPALFRRLLRMRTDRLQTLTQELVQKISGHGGGLMGLRLKPEDRGRGIQGEGLREEIAAPTERGWAEYSWLDEESACWEGIAKEVYLEKWDGMEDAKRGPNRLDDGKWKEEHPLVEAGEDGAELQSTPVQVPVVEMEDDVAVETERSL